MAHEYHIHTDDNRVTKITTDKHHHTHYGGDVIAWFNDHKKLLTGLVTAGASVLIVKHGDVVIWRK